jgi:hypothetical protein
MQNILQTTKKINVWKAVTLKEQLNLSIIKAGYAPSHKLMSRITIIKKEEESKFVEKFYLDHNTESQKLLLQSILIYDEEETPILLIERHDRVRLTIRQAK